VMRVFYNICNISHFLLSIGFKSGELRGLRCSGKNSGVFSLTTQLYHVRNEHFKFNKVVQRHYSGEVKNIYAILQHIYLGNNVPHFVSVARVL